MRIPEMSKFLKSELEKAFRAKDVKRIVELNVAWNEYIRKCKGESGE